MTEPLRDPFPASDFDPWADSYDRDVVEYSDFPFAGYDRVLERVVALADVDPGLHILDLGTGTGNLAIRLANLGCSLWCTDFSEPMLSRAREKLPQAKFFLHDLRTDFPEELNRRFDRIVSGYVFHHFDLDKKVSFCHELVSTRLVPDGRLVIADLSFPSEDAKNEFARGIPDWEEEFYWLADESVEAFTAAGMDVVYEQVSSCAGIYLFQKGDR